MDLNLSNSLIPGDPRLIDHIVGQVKSQGIFDQFRKECIADVDTKPAYQNLRSRVEGSVNSFLDKQNWKPDQNKNQLRESLRKHIHDAPYLDIGVERIVDQVVNPKTYNVFMPQIEDLVYKFLGIERPKAKEKNGPCNLKDLLPKDLDPVSPVSDKNSLKDISMESLEDDSQSNMEIANGDDRRTPPLIDRVKIEPEVIDVKKEEVPVEIKEEKEEVKANVIQNDAIKTEEKPEDEEEDSPVFEPIDIMNLNESNMSNDSHLSGISELTSHRSKSPDFEFGRDNFDASNQDSQLSKVSSDSRLSIVTDFGSSNQGSNLNTEDKSKEKTVWNFDLESIKSKDSSQDSEEKVSKVVTDGNNKVEKIDKEKSSSSSSSSKDDPSKSKSSSKGKERSSSKDSRSHHKDKDRERDRDKKRHSSRSSDKKSRNSKDKVDESSKSRESKSDKNDKKDPSKDGKDLKDIYKEKIRELREKKEMTEKEKLNKISTESKEKRDLSKDKNKSRSSSTSKSKESSRSERDKDKDRDRSKESKDKSRRSESDSRKSSKDEKKARKDSDRTKSSERSDKVDDKNKDKSSRDKKRRDDKKRSKDDHSSLRKSSSDRRSTDRDGANGSNSKSTHKSSSGSNISIAKISSSNVNKSESGSSQCSSDPSDNIKHVHQGSSSKTVEKQADGDKVTEPETCDKSHNPALPLKKRPFQKEEPNTEGASAAKKQKMTLDTEMKKSSQKFDSDKVEREEEKDVRCLPDYERVQIIEVPVEYDDLDTSEEQTPWDMENTPNDILRRDATFQPNQLRSFIINDEPEPSEQWTLRLSPVQEPNITSKDSTNQDKNDETKQSSTGVDEITRELSVNIQRLPQETNTRELKRKKGRPPKDKSEKSKIVEEEKEIDDSLDSLEFSEPSDEMPQKKRGRGRGRPKKNRDEGSSASTLPNGDNLVAPLSPESDVSTADKQTSKEEKTRQRSKQHYTSDDLYKPRLSSSLSRRNRRSNPA